MSFEFVSHIDIVIKWSSVAIFGQRQVRGLLALLSVFCFIFF